METSVGTDPFFDISRDLARSITNEAHVGIVYLDEELRFRYANQVYLAWRQFDWPTLRGKRLADVVGDSIYSQVRDRLEQALQGHPITFEFSLPENHFKASFLEVSYKPHRDTPDRVTGIIVTLTDITARKVAERRLTTQHEVVKILSTARSLPEIARPLLETLATGLAWDTAAFWKVDPVRNVLTCVETWHDEHESLGNFTCQSRDVTFAPGMGTLGQAWAQREILWSLDMMKETNLVRADLVARAGLKSGIAVPLRADGDIRGVVEFLSFHTRPRDPEVVSELASLGAQLNQFLKYRDTEVDLQRAAKVEAVGRLAGGIAHDFNNLLTVISGYAELLLAEVGDQHPLTAAVQEIANAAHRAENLTQHLLLVSHKKKLAPVLMDLNDLLLNMQDSIRSLLGPDIELRLVLAPAVDAVRLDPAHIRQMIVHLVSNARDAMEAGGTLTLQTANAHLDIDYTQRHVDLTPGQYAQLIISDTGKGMPPELMERIYDPFFTTKPRGQGAGMGLAIVEGIVRQSEGHIVVYSEAGVGTTFKVYFPRASEPRLRAPAPAKSALPRGTETVLVLDDVEAVRMIATKILQAQGYQVMEAASGEQALALQEDQARKIDLIVSDVMMPGLKGPEVVKRLRQRCPSLKALFISGFTDEDMSRLDLLDPGVPFLSKPFSIGDLVSSVRRVLDGTWTSSS